MILKFHQRTGIQKKSNRNFRFETTEIKQLSLTLVWTAQQKINELVWKSVKNIQFEEQKAKVIENTAENKKHTKMAKALIYMQMEFQK